jgi:hypothetical protein
MGEHKDRDRHFPDRQRTVIPEKPKHPLGWACENCFHALKDPASTQMVCCRHPPVAQIVSTGIVSLHPPVSLGEWCGEFKPLESKLI